MAKGPWARVRNTSTAMALASGLVIMLYIAWFDVEEKKQAFDMGLRLLRFGAAFAVFSV